MKISGINAAFPKLNSLDQIKKPTDLKFGNVFTDFVKQVNTNQLKSGEMTRDFVTGGDVELHEVMAAGQKAKTSLDLLVDIRNKTVDMYKELTRMQ